MQHWLADRHTVGRAALPTGADIMARGLELLQPGQRLGILHYQWFRPAAGFRNIAVITVLVGFNNRARLYSVYERE